MASRRSVLIVTHAVDDHVPRVIAELKRQDVPFTRLDTDDYLQGSDAQFAVEAGAHRATFNIHSNNYRGEQFAAVFFRHFKATPLVGNADEDGVRLVASERMAALEGTVLALQPALWANHPQANQNARNKVRQLRVACDIGFEIPDTLVSADPFEIRACFAKWNGRMVSKLVGGQLVGRTVDDQFVIHTTRLDNADLDDDASLAAAPACYQRLVPKAFDVRATVVGDRVFACRIASQDNAAGEIDWRAAGYQSLAHDSMELPAEVNARCLAITRHFGLHIAGIDLIQRPDGTFVFLEINAVGQWAWVEDMTGQPIAAEIARQLATVCD